MDHQRVEERIRLRRRDAQENPQGIRVAERRVVANQRSSYLYDGNLIVQERDANNLPLVTYTRGRDLSGNLQGAGGIGGLLARTDNVLLLGSRTLPHAYYHADGNGNITCLIYTNQLIAARYEFDPYGYTLSQFRP